MRLGRQFLGIFSILPPDQVAGENFVCVWAQVGCTPNQTRGQMTENLFADTVRGNIDYSYQCFVLNVPKIIPN